MHEATLAELADIGDPVNGLPGEISGEFVRDRWNQRASVLVTDAQPVAAIFTNHSLHNVWRKGNAKLGNAIVNDDVTGVDIVIPQP